MTKYYSPKSRISPFYLHFHYILWYYLHMEELKFILARNLTAYRKAMNLTQLELAEKLNYSDKAVSKWERAESVPDILILKKIADLYHITVDDLIKDKDVTKIKVKAMQKNKKLSRWMMMLLSVGLVWLIAVCAYVVLDFFKITQIGQGVFQSYHVFILAIPVSFIVATVLSFVWFRWYVKFICLSALVWCIAMCIDVMLISSGIGNSYLFYLICVPIQLIIIFWFILKYVRKPKQEKGEDKENCGDK